MPPEQGIEQGRRGWHCVPVAAVLLGLRFVLELCLLAAGAVIGAAQVDGPAASAVAGVAMALAVAIVWGLLLAPRRRFDLPLPVRVVVEVALFLAVGAGLASAGHVGAAIALVAAELVLLPLLAFLGHPPGAAPPTPAHAADAPPGSASG
jgi:hypothetical protein